MRVNGERNRESVRRIKFIRFVFGYGLSALVLMGGCLQSGLLRAADVTWGNIKADKILFLGNSITLHGPYVAWLPDAHWGMAASEESKDYVHLLAKKIDAKTGGSLAVAPPDPLPGRWYNGNPLPNYNGNILNMADIFERSFNTWDNARIQNQLDAKPDIVILQVGENKENGTDEEFAVALNSLLAALKSASDPQIVITSRILGTDPAIDKIKRDACAADPDHRVFVDLVGRVSLNPALNHPNDAGMQTIADALFSELEARAAVPEPGSVSLLIVAGPLLGAAVWLRRREKP